MYVRLSYSSTRLHWCTYDFAIGKMGFKNLNWSRCVQKGRRLLFRRPMSASSVLQFPRNIQNCLQRFRIPTPILRVGWNKVLRLKLTQQVWIELEWYYLQVALIAAESQASLLIYFTPEWHSMEKTRNRQRILPVKKKKSRTLFHYIYIYTYVSVCTCVYVCVSTHMGSWAFFPHRNLKNKFMLI